MVRPEVTTWVVYLPTPDRRATALAGSSPL